jgi:hypothetical protein
MALTDIKVRTAKPTDKQYKLTDGNGCTFLFIQMALNTGVCSTDLAESKRCWIWVFT